MRSTLATMATITVRLDDNDLRLLDELAREHGGRSAAVREALRLLSGEQQRQRALAAFVDAWNDEAGPVDEAEVERMIALYDL